MTLSELLVEELILTKIECSSKNDLISKLVECIYTTSHELPIPKEEVLNIIEIREQIGGTLLPSGLSVPHARLKDYDDFIIAIGIPKEPLIHEGFQIRLMALMITSQIGVPHYLPTLAALTKVSKNSELFSHLCNAENAGDFINKLKEQDLDLA